MATTTRSKVVQSWAGRCTQGGSDKVWALVQAVSSDDPDSDEAVLELSTTGQIAPHLGYHQRKL